MKNSLRISTFIIALVVIIAGVSTSYASGTRLKSLGMSSADTYWMLQKDTGLTAYNPAYFVQFPALITFNEQALSPTVNNPTGMIWLAPMDDLRIILIGQGALSESALTGTYAFKQIPTGATGLSTMTMRENYNVAASYKMGNMSFGLRYGSADRLEKNTTTSGADTTNEKSIQTIAGGFFMDLGSGMDFDAAVKYTQYDYSQKGIAIPNKYKADPTDLDVMGRFNMGLSEMNRIHVWVRYNPMDRTDKLGTVKRTYTIDKNSIGISDELKFTQNALAYFGFLYEMIAEEDKVTGTKITTDTTNLLFLTGAEASLTKNVTMRVGLNRQWNVAKTEKTTGLAKKEQNTDSALTGTWGLQYKMGHWTLEAQMRRELLTDGPYLVSGKINANGGWAAEVNLGYTFGQTAVYDDDMKK